MKQTQLGADTGGGGGGGGGEGLSLDDFMELLRLLKGLIREGQTSAGELVQGRRLQREHF